MVELSRLGVVHPTRSTRCCCCGRFQGESHRFKGFRKTPAISPIRPAECGAKIEVMDSMRKTRLDRGAERIEGSEGVRFVDRMPPGDWESSRGHRDLGGSGIPFVVVTPEGGTLRIELCYVYMSGHAELDFSEICSVVTASDLAHEENNLRTLLGHWVRPVLIDPIIE